MERSLREILFSVKNLVIAVAVAGTVIFSLYGRKGRNLTESDLEDLRKGGRGGRGIVAELVEEGVPNRDVRGIIESLKPLNDQQVEVVYSLYKSGFSPKQLEELAQILNSIPNNLDTISELIDEGSYGEALDLSITVKGNLEVLRRKYNLDTRGVEARLLELREKWRKRVKGA